MSWTLLGGVIAIFAALFTLTLAVSGSMTRAGQDRDLVGRIGRYGPRQRTSPANGDSSSPGKPGGVVLSVTNRLISPAAEQRISARLELAAVARKPAEWVLLGGCVGVVAAAAVTVLFRNVLIGIVIGAAVGPLSMMALLSFLIRRRRHAFAEQLPNLLQLIASSLQSGFSLPQALDAVVREAPQPSAGEFARALAEARLGGDMESCLETLADRMNSDDLRWTVLALRIQREVGGNLAEVLTTIVGTIRERGYLRRQVRALSADGRLSANVLIGLPIVAGGFLLVTKPAYMRPLYTTHVGELMLAAAVVLMAIGIVLIRQVIKVEF